MATKVLLIGGHGKVALHLTPLLLAKSWTVTSLVRNPDHESEILKLADGKPGQLNVLVDSLDDIRSDDAAKKVLDQVDPDIVVWSAGRSNLVNNGHRSCNQGRAEKVVPSAPRLWTRSLRSTTYHRLWHDQQSRGS